MIDFMRDLSQWSAINFMLLISKDQLCNPFANAISRDTSMRHEREQQKRKREAEGEEKRIFYCINVIGFQSNIKSRKNVDLDRKRRNKLNFRVP